MKNDPRYWTDAFDYFALHDRVWFTSQGVYIHTQADPQPWLFSGTPIELLSILVANPQIDIEHAEFIVRPEGVH